MQPRRVRTLHRDTNAAYSCKCGMYKHVESFFGVCLYCSMLVSVYLFWQRIENYTHTHTHSHSELTGMLHQKWRRISKTKKHTATSQRVQTLTVHNYARRMSAHFVGCSRVLEIISSTFPISRYNAASNNIARRTASNPHQSSRFKVRR